MHDDFGIRILCPCCGNGMIAADRRMKLRVSAVCPICKRVFIADLWRIKAYRPGDEVYERLRPFSFSYSCPCPYCRGKVLADGTAEGFLSVKCSRLHEKEDSMYYRINLKSGSTYPAMPIRSYGRG